MWYSTVGCSVTLSLSLFVMPLTAKAQRPTTIPRLRRQ
jgi:hypothetical protein